MNVFANKVQIAITNECAGQQACLAEDLKAVTNTEHEAATFGKLLDGIHYGRKAREGSGTQVVSVRKAARKYHCVVCRQIRFTVPDEIDWLSDVFRDHVIGIVIAVRTRKNNNSEFHASISTR